MKKYLVGMIAGAALFVAAIPAFAGTTVNTAVTITMPTLADISWSAGGTTLAVNPIASDLVAGTIASTNFGTLQTDTNCSFDMTVEADAATFGGTGSGTKPSSEMSITVAGAGSDGTVALNGVTPVNVITGGTAGLATAHQVDADTVLAADDTAGTYTMTLTFTIAGI